MSLDKAAKHLAAHGRGPDTELVHMSKDEVKGLQQMAMAAGGSLTINPHTGLAEAGFLSKMLPTVAGIAAGAMTGNPMIGAAVAGGLTAAESGSLQQGIIAGGMAYAGSAIGGDMFGSPVTPAPVTDYSTAFVPPTVAPTVAPTISADVTAPVVNTPAVNTPVVNTPIVNAPVNTPIGNGPFSSYEQALNTAPQTTANNANQYFDKIGTQANAPTAQTPAASKSWWEQRTGPQQVAIGGTGVLAALSLMNQAGNKGLPSTTQSYSGPTLSSNFQGYTPPQPNPYYRATYAAGGGLMEDSYAPGGPVEAMSQANQNQFYPQGQQEQTNFATPTQMPISAEVVDSSYEPKINAYSGIMMASGGNPADKKKKKASLTTAAKIAAQDPYEASLSGLGNAMYHSQMPNQVAKGLQPTTNLGQLDLAEGGHLGSYSDGGRLLKGPGDGVSDNIPARIGKYQPARLADGEFVIPARIVSELGNGSTDAGARRLYEMMDKVQASRKKSMGKGKFAVNSRAAKHLPKK